MERAIKDMGSKTVTNGPEAVILLDLNTTKRNAIYRGVGLST